MTKIALKSVTREAVREAVNGVFTRRKTLGKSVAAAVSKSSVRKTKKH